MEVIKLVGGFLSALTAGGIVAGWLRTGVVSAWWTRVVESWDVFY